MTLADLARRLWALERRRLALAALLTALVPLTGLALLGLSGWFVAASAVAGLAGLGLVFDFFRPAAAIRLLSPARAAARYGERLIGHDATLRALNVLRGELFAGLLTRPATEQAHLRSAQGLNRLSADLDAVEGVAIRLVLPLAATLIVLPVGLGVIVWLAGWVAGLAAGALYLAAVAGLLALSGPRLVQAAAAEEEATQALRAETAEALRLRSHAALAGTLPELTGRIEAATHAAEAARGRLDAAERRADLLLTLAPVLAAACVLGLGQEAGPARVLGAALVALALAEAPRGLWRGLAERGRITAALVRWPAPAAAPAPRAAPQPVAKAPRLVLDAVVTAPPGGGRALFAPIDLTLQQGDWAGLVAPSGSGKSSLLLAIAGLAPVLNGTVRLLGHPLDDWPEAELRQHLTLVPQRPALIAGTVAENLALAAPDATAEACEAALRAVALWEVLAPRGGLSARLGARGAGLSGGESRRLALARAVLRRPAVLLLDEPTEGLDPATAATVLAGLRRALPDAAVLIASHRAADVANLGQIVQPTRFPGACRALA